MHPTHAGPPADTVQRGRILVAVLLGIFLSVLDQTIVATALPVIATDLGGVDRFTWVTTAYLLTATVSIPFYGKLSDQVGRKPLLVAGILIFLAGSVLSGLAASMDMLIASRALQGVGAGSLFPIGLAVIGDHYAPAERARPQALFGAVFALSAVLGPTLGGWLTEAGGWPWVFFLNVPIGLVTIALVARSLPGGSRPTARPHVDVAGAVSLAVAIGLLLLGLTNKQSGEWRDPWVGGLLAASMLATATFLFVEARAEEPILPLGLFRDPTFAAAMMASLLVSVAFYGAVVFLPLWFQVVDGTRPSDAGVRSLALLSGLVVGAVAAGRLVARTGRYRWLLMGASGLAILGFLLLGRLTPQTPMPLLGGAMFVAGLGLGPTFSVLTVVAQSSAPPGAMGVASSTLTFVRQIGGAVGLALLGTVYSETVMATLPASLARHGVPEAARDALAVLDLGALTQVGGDLNGALLASLPGAAAATVHPVIGNVVEAVKVALTHGVTATFIAAAIALIVATAASFALREVPLRGAREAGTRLIAPAAAQEGLG